MKKIAALILIYTLFGCKETSNKMVINYYINGNVRSIKPDDSDQEKVFGYLSDLYLNTTDRLRVHLGENRIQKIKESEEVLEIKIDSVISFISNQYGKTKADRILIPLSGEFIGNKHDQMITLLIGNGNYNTGPLRNNTGYGKLMELKKVILNIP